MSVSPLTIQSGNPVTDIAMTGTSITTTAAGDYVVHLNLRMHGAVGASDQGVISIYHNGTQILTTERLVLLPSNTSMPISTQAHLTGVALGDTIDGRWRTINGNTISLRQRSLIVLEVN